ncbi:MAG: 2,3-bisphosphoglycerate-independent phosphoglycerate mutase [Candidatus Woesearchaeota archaeon]
MEKKISALFMVLDGLGDYIHPKYKKTPLMMAKKTNLTLMEKQAETGLMQPTLPGLPVGSDTGHLALFGYDPFQFYAGRGPYEALGAGFELSEEDIALRVNFATEKDGKIVDRRVGRNDYKLKELAESLSYETEDVKYIVLHTTEHRGVLIIRPKKKILLGTNVTDYDHEPLQEVKALSTKVEDKKTAELINEFIKNSVKKMRNHPINKERESKGLLPANFILLRGAGKLPKYSKIEEVHSVKMVCIAGGALYKGVARAVGMFVPDIEGATGDKNTNLMAKVNAAIKFKYDYDIVFMHIKATDNFGHDGDFEGKKNFIEKVDKIMKPLMENFDVILITADHSTPVTVKRHTGDPVPIMLWAKPELGITRPDNGGFHELSKGTIRITALDVLRLIRNKINMVKKFGE